MTTESESPQPEGVEDEVTKVKTLSLPDGILERVSSYCFANELASFLTVSRSLHRHAIRQLFLFVALRIERPETPPARLDPHPFVFLFPITRLEPSLDDDSSVRFYQMSKYPPRFPLRPLPPANYPAFIYTRHLMLDPHYHSDCRMMEPLLLPNLITLRIRTPAGHHPAPYSQSISIPEGQRCCNTLTELRPRRLKFGLTHSDKNYHDLNFWQMSPPALIKSVEEVMFILSLSPDRVLSGQPLARLFHDVPITVQRLVIVIDSCMAGWPKWGPGWGFDAGPEERYDEIMKPKSMRRFIAMACTGKAEVVEVVGLETMIDVFNENSMERGRREVREELINCLVEKGWAKDKAEERAEGLIFTNGY